MENIKKEIIIAVSNSYIEKYYLISEFEKIPDDVKNELKISMVSFTDMVGGMLELRYDVEEKCMSFYTYRDDADFMYDEIEAKYKLRKLEREIEDLINSLEEYAKYKFAELC